MRNTVYRTHGLSVSLSVTQSHARVSRHASLGNYAISHRTAGTHATLGLAKREQAKWRRQRGGARHARRLSSPPTDSAGGRPLPALALLACHASARGFGSQLRPTASVHRARLAASAHCFGSLHRLTYRLTASSHASNGSLLRLTGIGSQHTMAKDSYWIAIG